MNGENENRVAIKFYFKAGLSATETLVLVQKACGNEALNRPNVFRGYSRFRNGRVLVEDDERGGRPKSTRNEIPKVPHQERVDNFFDSQGIVHKEFVPEEKTVNAEFYKGVMHRLL